MRVRSRRLGSLVMAALLLVAMAGTAQASGGIYDQGSYDQPWTDTLCDKYDIEGRDFGHWQIQDATKATGYQFFYYTQWYNGHTKITNPANGKWMTEDWSGIFKEINAKAHKDDPNVFTFETVDASAYRVKNSRGKIVHFEAPLIVTRRVFDTLGDSQPGGQELEYKELINTWDQTFDICALADKVIG